MLCNCGIKEALKIGNVITDLGNEVNWMECSKCGVVEVNGQDIPIEEWEDVLGEEHRVL